MRKVTCANLIARNDSIFKVYNGDYTKQFRLTINENNKKKKKL